MTGAVSVPSTALTFSTMNWGTAQAVTVFGDADAVDESVTVTATAASTDGEYQGETASVTVSVTDSDTAGLVVDPASLTISEDGTGSFTVKLATQPVGGCDGDGHRRGDGGRPRSRRRTGHHPDRHGVWRRGCGRESTSGDGRARPRR